MWATLFRLVRRTAPGPARLLGTIEEGYGFWTGRWQRRHYDTLTRRDPWWERLGQLEEFCATHNCVPRSTAGSRKPWLEPSERLLGVWCNSQRQRWRGNRRSGGCLSPEQVAALEGIPCWQWDPFAAKWWQHCQELAAFTEAHAQQPRQAPGDSALAPNEQVLGVWCMHQRQRNKGRAGCSALSADQQAALQRIPGWAWEPHDELWEQRCAEVEAFTQAHGKLPRGIPGNSPLAPNERVLGVWCWHQRGRNKGTGGRSALSADQRAALQRIPKWQWEREAAQRGDVDA